MKDAAEKSAMTVVYRKQKHATNQRQNKWKRKCKVALRKRSRIVSGAAIVLAGVLSAKTPVGG